MDYNDLEEDRRQVTAKRGRKFSKRLDVRHLSVKKDNKSFRAQLIRTIASGVSQLITPRQLLTALFILAAYTIVFFFSTIVSDIIFIYVELFYNLSEEVTMKLGNFHDATIRFFGVGFAILAIMVELDLDIINKKVNILKSFIPRSFFLLFVATLSETNPMITYELKHRQTYSYYGNDDIHNSNYFSGYGNTNSSYTDDLINFNLYGDDFNGSTDDDMNQSSEMFIQDELPLIVIRLQSLSASLLQLSVIIYFLLGLLCLDQFEPNAFIPGRDRKIGPEYLPRELSERRQRVASGLGGGLNMSSRSMPEGTRNNFAHNNQIISYV